MYTRLVTTPFGGRPATLALVKGQLKAEEAPIEASVDKWQVFRDICDARVHLKLRDRSLAVLDALLSFYPESHLSRESNLVVFPSNKRLAARANGMAATTLRENLLLLVEAGVIHRRDSPNGKRYARKGKGGEIEEAYGFSLAPLLARAGEFALLAQKVADERERVRILRERISLLRRDVRKLIEAATMERLDGHWRRLETEFHAVLSTLPRAKSVEDLAGAEQDLARLQTDIVNQLKIRWKTEESGGNDGDFRQHLQNQNTDSLFEFEDGFEKKPAATLAPTSRHHTQQILPLQTVIRACPEIAMYGRAGGVTSWADLKGAALVVRATLGISPSAYQEACDVLGQENAAVVVACILERHARIRSPGGYLRNLTRKAAQGSFSLGSMVMALLRTSES